LRSYGREWLDETLAGMGAESPTGGRRSVLAGTWRKSRERTRLAPAKATTAAAPAHAIPDTSRLSRRSSEYLPPPALASAIATTAFVATSSAPDPVMNQPLPR